MQIVSQILSCFKISSTKLLALQALQCSKRLTNPMTLTKISLLSKSTSSTSTKSPLQMQFQHFSGEDTDKKYRLNAPKHAISSEKLILVWGGG